MASIVITIQTDGPAFHEKGESAQGERMSIGYEAAYVLHGIANSLERHGLSGAFDPRDRDGSRVGTVEVTA